jgi:hypothetical protein
MAAPARCFYHGRWLFGFPDIGLQGIAPKLAKREIASLSGSQDDPRYFQINAPGTAG